MRQIQRSTQLPHRLGTPATWMSHRDSGPYAHRTLTDVPFHTSRATATVPSQGERQHRAGSAYRTWTMEQNPS
eukprot:CAMPEP_0117658880 /NCGR_PEP_ID=MMETSP0804-20121206/6108_1 /TAXON_ID=1074897 /ORGANISM="Tetraselmis astigmatica, Strain CCMP880" /LENGTH=72 /DNA_ID=CAMNT_0005465447 /DNA_START=80 /DNA_END=295 /DNA_ORIENTATION=+